MPLSIEVPKVNPEVEALKAQVREVAQRYAKKHNWCGVVNQALREAGVMTGHDRVKVEIEFTVSGSEPQKAVKEFASVRLAGKTDEEQKQYVSEKIAPKVKVAGVDVTLPVTVIDLNLVEEIKAVDDVPNPIKAGLEYPDGYHHLYTSDSGRVAHLVSHGDVVEVARNGRFGDTVAFPTDYDQVTEDHLRNALRNGRYGITAICGQTGGYNHPSRTSTRSENRVCEQCLRRANPPEPVADDDLDDDDL